MKYLIKTDFNDADVIPFNKDKQFFVISRRNIDNGLIEYFCGFEDEEDKQTRTYGMEIWTADDLENIMGFQIDQVHQCKVWFQMLSNKRLQYEYTMSLAKCEDDEIKPIKDFFKI